MKTIKRVTTRIVLGIAVFGSVMTAGSASAFTVDQEIINMINGIIVQMQQQTMAELYPQAPLKNQMRGKMMQEFSSKTILMNQIQPVMMEANLKATKNALMERMVSRPIPLPGS
ncbi:hypothetical protein VU08_03825 [Desulfobulbus sp. F5]|nr:hypothetical protein [Desulfobulbus sp. F5]